MSSSCVLQAEALLYQYGQEHILPFLGKLTGEEQSSNMVALAARTPK
ncbi:hypothetical protein [Paenibacillus contaminans]|nr:hypothetical protein [Paenibacillus contaminans]